MSHGRPHFAGISGAERKKFRIFFIFFLKSIVYLKSYINFEEIINTKNMKALKNTKIINLEEARNKGYFNIDCGKFGEMVFSFDIEFDMDRDGDLNGVTIYLDNYDWECENEERRAYGNNLQLNNRNTKMICEYIEDIIMCDPYSFGFDPYELLEDQCKPDYYGY